MANVKLLSYEDLDQLAKTAKLHAHDCPEGSQAWNDLVPQLRIISQAALKSIPHRQSDEDDLISIGVQACISALQTWKGPRWYGKYATQKAKWVLRRQSANLRHIVKQPQDSLSPCLDTELPEEEKELPSSTPSPISQILKAEQLTQITAAIQLLPTQERKVISALYGPTPTTRVALAAKLHVSHQRISYIEHSALKRLKSHFNKQESGSRHYLPSC